MASRRCIINAIMTPPTGNAYLAAIALLALLPVAALAWRRRRDGRRLPWQPGRAFLCFALAFLALVWADRLRGTPAVMGLAAVLYGFLAGRAGMGRFHALRYGSRLRAALPDLADEDAGRLHLFFMIMAVACVTVGLILATWPRTA